MTSASPDIALDAALSEFERLLAGVPEDGWGAPTPCGEWTVRELVNHVVFGLQATAATLRGEQPDMATHDADHLGGQPVAAYRAGGAELRAELARPGVAEQLFTTPFGTRVPGLAAKHIRLVELLTHGWDLARATGQTAQFPEDLAERVLAVAPETFSRVYPGTRPFGQAQPVDEHAPALDRLVASLGRPVAVKTES